MAYDETVQGISRFNQRELYDLPQIQSGEVDLPQKFLDGAIKLQKVESSPIIEDFVRSSFDEGRLVVVKSDYKIPTPKGEHTVAWCRVCDAKTGDDHYQVVCDHIGEVGYDAMDEELLLACRGVQEAIMIRSYVVQDRFGNRKGLADAKQNYGGRRGVVRFFLDYAQNQPHSWLVNHRSDQGIVEGFAALLEISAGKMKQTAKLMALEGDIELSGPDDQVMIPLKAA